MAKKIHTVDLIAKKRAGERIVCLTAHDALSAATAQAAGADIILVGDSLGMTSLGLPDTLRVTLDMMLHHCAAVARAASLPLLIGDMPFMTYKISAEQALTNAARMLQEGGMQGVKLEGGEEMAPTAARLVASGIPVMGHIGMRPQSFHAQGGYRVQGREGSEAETLMREARALEEAGAFSLVLEGMPPSVAAAITSALTIPTIGIGAGAQCDGQVLVYADVLGMHEGRVPKFVRKYADLHEAALKGLREFAADVREGRFPGPEQSYRE